MGSVFICFETSPGSGFVFGRCNYCGQIHEHSEPGNGTRFRVPHCVPRRDRPQYELQVQDGPAPAWLRKAWDLPLGECEIAIRSLTTAMSGLWREPSSAQEIPIPSPEDIRFTLNALRSCNFGFEASEIADYLKTANADRGRASKSFWVTQTGQATRWRIIATLRRCIATLGGYAPASEKAGA